MRKRNHKGSNSNLELCKKKSRRSCSGKDCALPCTLINDERKVRKTRMLMNLIYHLLLDLNRSVGASLSDILLATGALLNPLSRSGILSAKEVVCVTREVSVVS